MSASEAVRPTLDGMQKRFLIIGIVGMVALIATSASNMTQLYRSYLTAFLMWGGIGIGSLGILMLHHMVGGGWGVAIRRGLEAGTRTLPLVFVLSIPLIVGMHDLYEWSHAEVVAKDPILQHKSAYLNSGGFIVRLIIYFAIWIGLATLLNKYSEEQESAGYWAVRPKLQKVSAPGLLIFVTAATFAAFDWMMSLEPHWFSTVYGAMFVIGCVLSTFAFNIVLTRMLTKQAGMENAVPRQTFHDLGNLLLAFTMFFAYLAFSQFLIIYSANLPEEIVWYLRRMNGGWGGVFAVLTAFHFAVPFLLLLFRKNKKQPSVLASIAMFILIMRMIEIFWQIQPAFAHNNSEGVPQPHFAVHPSDLTALVGVGGIWIAFFFFQLKRRPIDPMPLA